LTFNISQLFSSHCVDSYKCPIETLYVDSYKCPIETLYVDSYKCPIVTLYVDSYKCPIVTLYVDSCKCQIVLKAVSPTLKELSAVSNKLHISFNLKGAFTHRRDEARQSSPPLACV